MERIKSQSEIFNENYPIKRLADALAAAYTFVEDGSLSKAQFTKLEQIKKNIFDGVATEEEMRMIEQWMTDSNNGTELAMLNARVATVTKSNAVPPSSPVPPFPTMPRIPGEAPQDLKNFSSAAAGAAAPNNPNVPPIIPPSDTASKTDVQARAQSQVASRDPKLTLREKNSREKLRVAFVDTEKAIEDQARDIAEEKLTAEKSELAGFKGFFKKIWKHNLAREYYRQREIIRVKREILESGNLYHHETTDKVAHDEAMQNVVERFVSEYDETLHHGETRSGLDLRKEEENKMNQEIRAVIRNYALGLIEEGALIEEKNRIISESLGLEGDKLALAIRNTDNLVEVARQAKLAVEHGASIDELDREIEIVKGTARVGVRTEAKYNLADKIISKLQKSFVGRIFGNEVVASAVAIGYASTIGFAERVARSKALAWGTLGASALIGGAIFAGKERVRLEDERAAHAREMAKGKEIAPDSKRRQEMEVSRYETKKVGDLIQSLEHSIPNVKDQKDLLTCVNLLAEIESRIKLSDTQKIDLIEYSDFKSVEKERLDLDIARARAKVALRKMVEENKVAIPGGKPFDEFCSLALNAKSKEIVEGDTGIEKKNETFQKMKKSKAWKAFTKGVVVGLAGGVVVQESIAFFRDDQEGLIEDLVGADDAHPKSRTLLGWFSNGEETIRPGSDVKLPDGTKINIPTGVEVTPNPTNPGHYIFKKDGEVLSDSIKFEHGKIDPASEALLESKGINVDADTKLISSGEKGEHEVSSLKYAETNKDFKQIHRDFWYDNNTKKFDKNELRLHWGGKSGTGVDADGNYVYSIAKMKSGDSFFRGMSVDAQKEFRAGNMRMLLSLDRTAQFNVVEVKIDPNTGNAIIDPDSDIAKKFFRLDNKGQLHFIGKFAEVGYNVGPGEDGVDHYRILATDVGPGTKTVIEQFEKPPVEVTTTKFEVTDSDDLPIDVPWFVPIFGRTPLEPLKKNEGFVYTYNGIGRTKRADYENRMSSELKHNPDAKIDEKKEVKDYLQRQEQEHRQTIKDLANEAGPMSPECKLSVGIPVAIHQEGKNIYRTLENYLEQTANKNEFELVLFLNHPEKDPKGHKITPDETASEIARFKNDHPELNIRVMSKVLPIENARMGYIRKVMNDTILMRHQERGDQAPELILVSNDADNKGIAKEYIQNYISKFEKNKNVDALMGQLDWDPESYTRNPLLHIGTRLFQFVDVQLKHGDAMAIASSGANFAMRAGIYAAVNGYRASENLAEDVDLGRAIKAARIGSKTKMGIGFAGAKVSRLFTSSRRAEKALKDGLAPVEQWSKGFSAFDDEVRKVDWEKIANNVDLDAPEGKRVFLEQLENVINRTVKAMSWAGNDKKLFKNSLSWLGIKCNISKTNEVKIIDADKLIAGLKQYKTDMPKTVEKKTGTKPKETVEETKNTESKKKKAKKPAKPASKNKKKKKSTAKPADLGAGI